MYVRFVDGKGEEIFHIISLDRLPGPGEEIRLGGAWYVIQPTPIRHEPVNFPSGMQYVATLVGVTVPVAPMAPVPVASSKPLVSRKTKPQLVKETPR